MLQREIINKERKAFELEKNLSQKSAEVNRIKDERDRLVNISNDLRAELNKTKRTIYDFKR